MDIYGYSETKGVVIKYHIDGAIDAKSIVTVPGFFDADGAGQNDAEMFLVDFSGVASERVALMPCFGGRTYVFAYGHDMSSSRSSATVLIFLGSSNCKQANNVNALTKLETWYRNTRISKQGSGASPVKFVIGDSNGGISAGYLISLQIKGFNPDLNAATVTATFITVPPA